MLHAISTTIQVQLLLLIVVWCCADAQMLLLHVHTRAARAVTSTATTDKSLPPAPNAGAAFFKWQHNHGLERYS